MPTLRSGKVIELKNPESKTKKVNKKAKSSKNDTKDTKKAAKKTKKAPRISKLASCIRRHSASSRISRKMMIDSKSFNPQDYLPSMSAKFNALINKIKELDAADMRDNETKYKHFIFTDIRESSFGAKVLAGFMIANGFQLRNSYEKSKSTFIETEPVKGGCDGFALLQSNPLWKKPMQVATKKQILGVFNSRPDNVNGELLRIMILDSKFKEGIDLFDVKYVHLLEPALATSDLKQAVGRATRFCGQKGLHFTPRVGWPLQVFVYHTLMMEKQDLVAAGEDAHDVLMKYSGLDLALINLTKELTILAISSAVDYDLNYKINNFDVEEALLQADAAAEVTMVGGAPKTVVAIHDMEDITPDLIRRCSPRKTRLFPFTKLQLVGMARQLGIKVPKGAKRSWFCNELSENRAYFDAVFNNILPAVNPKRTSVQATPVTPFVQNNAINSIRGTFESPKTIPIIPHHVFPEPRETPARLNLFFKNNNTSNKNTQLTIADAENNINRALTKDLPFDEFQNVINKLYSKFKWASPIVKNGCSTVTALTSGRPVSFTKTQDFIRHYLTPESPFKGILAWHSVGTGKTCMAVAAATSQFEGAGYKILWVTRNALMADVYKNLFGAVCSIPIAQRIEDGLTIPKEASAQKRLLSRAWFKPISYRTFQNALEQKNELGRMLYANNKNDALERTFLIIDEIHKLQDGDLTASEAADFNVIQNFIHKSYETSGSNSVRPLLMTATPITDSPKELFAILNTLIPDADDRFIPFDEFREKYTNEEGSVKQDGVKYFRERAKGLISYLNRELDPTTFATPQFSKVIVPLGEVPVMEVGDLVDKCMEDVEVVKEPVDNCKLLSDEMNVEIDDVKNSGLTGRELRSELSNVKNIYKGRIKDCKAKLRELRKTYKASLKAARSVTRKCYAKHKKDFTKQVQTSQLTGMKSCFGKFKRQQFVNRAEFVNNVDKLFTGKTDESNNARSSMAVVTAAAVN